MNHLTSHEFYSSASPFLIGQQNQRCNSGGGKGTSGSVPQPVNTSYVNLAQLNNYQPYMFPRTEIALLVWNGNQIAGSLFCLVCSSHASEGMNKFGERLQCIVMDFFVYFLLNVFNGKSKLYSISVDSKKQCWSEAFLYTTFPPERIMIFSKNLNSSFFDLVHRVDKYWRLYFSD